MGADVGKHGLLTSRIEPGHPICFVLSAKQFSKIVTLLSRLGDAALGTISMNVQAVWRKPRAQLALTVEVATPVLESRAPAARPIIHSYSSLVILRAVREQSNFDV